jgi:hypothetical protein
MHICGFALHFVLFIFWNCFYKLLQVTNICFILYYLPTFKK